MLNNKNLFARSVMIAAQIGLSADGICPESAHAFMGYSVILNGLLGKQKVAYELGKA